VTGSELAARIVDRAFGCACESVVRTDPGPYQKTAHEYGCQGPDAWHPAFYGCWDWHSAVHSHFLIVRCLRCHTVDETERAAALSVLRRHLSKLNMAMEVASLRREKPGWECPYGLAWVLRLAQELQGWDAELSATVEPLERAAVATLAAWLEQAAAAPDRGGGHGSAAFAARLVLQHARARPDGVPEAVVQTCAKALAGLAPARACAQGHPFLSPLLVEAQLHMAAGGDSGWEWLRRLELGELLGLEPVRGDPHDIRTCHALGLNFSRAEGLAELATAWPDPTAAAMLLDKARAHLAASAPYLRSGGWMGDHWIGTFALLALEACLRAEAALQAW